jgi:hypothetical protein
MHIGEPGHWPCDRGALSASISRTPCFVLTRTEAVVLIGVSVIWVRTFSGIDLRIGVSMKPGATALQRMPLGPSSRDQVLTKPITPNLLAA